MKTEYIQEPFLFFGKGKSICPRDGIASLDVYDTVQEARKNQLLIGIVGIEADVENLKTWLKRFESYIPANPKGKQKGLFKSFPGFSSENGFCAKLLYGTNYERIISPNEIKAILNEPDRDKRILGAVELFGENIGFLSDIKNCDVVICVIPKSFEGKIVKENKDDEPVETDAEDNEEPELELNFRRALKALAMQYNTPIQLIREYVLHDTNKSQDAATKAWNFCTALYYKGLQTIPWKLEVDENRPKVCYVGIGFYRSRDKKTIQTSLAQIFNENGKGVILRGTPVIEDKDDRKPHLTYEQSYSLLKDALTKYKFATGTMPGRLVLHKTSKYYEDELDGFIQAMQELGITEYDIVTVMETDLRFFRNNLYPPVRGSLFSLTEDRHILYTRGSVHQYQTYPGMYIPAPLEIRIVDAVSSPKTVCKEILGLTKMNWNNTQFDNKYPITIGCARRVGEIMKYLSDNEHPKESYAFYM
ncbi:argonaute/piwi family protein [Olivibacter jilunii]|uniref:argonaute/piwi family protein n=1 Tax=Olivibacter jilunii TaxID=985016 RepID=UPI003F156943